MKTKGMIAVLSLAMGISLAVGCSGGQTTSDGVPDNASSGAPSSAPTPTVTATPTTPATTPTTNPTTPSSSPTPPPSSTASTAPSSTGSTAPASGPPDAARGEKLFTEQKCDGCHGTKKKPGRVPLFALKWDDKEKKKALEILHKGKGEMPKFEGKLTEAQMADLLEYVTTK
ncbi:MAG: cytochrome c [Polyangiaceae bacterium]